MAKQKAGSLVQEAISTAVVRAGNQPWYERVPPDVKSELVQAKADFKSGKINLPLRVFSRSLSKVMRSRGISLVGEQGVELWLRKD